jgi:hypothetical protein
VYRTKYHHDDLIGLVYSLLSQPSAFVTQVQDLATALNGVARRDGGGAPVSTKGRAGNGSTKKSFNTY